LVRKDIVCAGHLQLLGRLICQVSVVWKRKASA